eukprot:IDg5835t1
MSKHVKLYCCNINRAFEALSRCRYILVHSFRCQTCDRNVQSIKFRIKKVPVIVDKSGRGRLHGTMRMRVAQLHAQRALTSGVSVPCNRVPARAALLRLCRDRSGGACGAAPETRQLQRALHGRATAAWP